MKAFNLLWVVVFFLTFLCFQGCTKQSVDQSKEMKKIALKKFENVLFKTGKALRSKFQQTNSVFTSRNATTVVQNNQSTNFENVMTEMDYRQSLDELLIESQNLLTTYDILDSLGSEFGSTEDTRIIASAIIVYGSEAHSDGNTIFSANAAGLSSGEVAGCVGLALGIGGGAFALFNGLAGAITVRGVVTLVMSTASRFLSWFGIAYAAWTLTDCLISQYNDSNNNYDY
jgi:hypothetical protein